VRRLPISPLTTHPAPYLVPEDSEVATRISPWVRKRVSLVKTHPSTSEQSFSTFSTYTFTSRPAVLPPPWVIPLFLWALRDAITLPSALPVVSELSPILVGREPYNLA